MITVMESTKKYSVTTFDSFKTRAKELGRSYGDLSLQWNAALAWFLTTDPAERELWIQRVIAAKRTAGNRTTLERLEAILAEDEAKQRPEGHRDEGMGGASVSTGSPQAPSSGGGGAVSPEEVAKVLNAFGKSRSDKPQRRPRRSAGG